MTSMILDFVKLCKSHTGRYLADELVACLKDFGIEDKILGVVCDNASNNDTLVSHLEIKLCGQNGVRTRIRCFAHILNLAVKAILSPFSRKPKGVEDGDDDNEDDDNDMLEDLELYDIQPEDEKEEDEVDEGRESSDDSVIDDIAGEVDEEIYVSAAQIAVVRSALTKVCHQTTLLPALSDVVSAEEDNQTCVPHVHAHFRSRRVL